ncbi:hypothetical protein [Microcoleus sp. S13C4]|uniref:hypothetical protein n=1 Tax=Microcoleus sp. S13C4 TaxID=3055410 RepID=UPI002FD56439
MNGTDKVWVGGVQETAMAPPRLTPTHSGSLGMGGVLGFWFSLPQKPSWRSQMTLCS